MNPQRGTIGPEDYQQVREVFEAALKYPAADRAGFVERACSADARLIVEVQRMLAADADTHSLLDGRPFIGQGLHEGDRFADHFQIAGKLGSGGMGEVYLGRDAKLNREVAIKVLPSTFTGDPDRLARFRREAQVLASLNHPNIGAIYSFEESDGTHALALEYVEGPTLAERIARGPIPLDAALSIARQIAEALEAAHEQGIVHRDLKPANIKLRPDGTVKVLDFGLAKAVQPEGMRSSESDLPEITSPAMIAMGLMMGTPAYMSPEQVKGCAVDRRADIWAFGAVLFEMLTGRRAFQGEDTPETLSSVLRQEIDWSALPEETPAPVRNLIARCLQRDARLRLRDIGEARIQLDEDGLKGQTPERSLWRRSAPFILTAAIAAGLSGWVAHLANRTQPVGSNVVRLSLVLPDGQPLFNGPDTIAISPDGNLIAYARPSGIYVRPLPALETKVVRGTEGLFNLTDPAFSPDGRDIVFFSGADQALRRVPVAGGAAVTLCKALNPGGVSWMNEGILFTTTAEDAAARQYDGHHRILLVSPDGGVPKPLVTLDNGERAGRPQFLPGGRQLLFTVATGGGPGLWNNAQVVVQDLTSGKRTVVLNNGSDARYVRTGHLVYASNGSLFAIAFDVGKLRTVGGAVPVVEGVMRAAPGSMANAHYSFSTSGTLIYVPGPVSPGWDLAWADRKGLVEPFQLPQRFYDAPRVSPDDKQVAFESMDGNEAGVYVYNLSGQSAIRRLTFHGNNRLPIWSSDGKRVAFQSDREGDRAIFWQLADGTDLASRLTKPEPGESHEPESWSPDGEFLLFSVTKGNDISLSTLSMRTKAIARFGDVHSSMPTNATFSPDGKWVAYSQSEGEQSSIFVQPFPATGIRHELPRDGAEKPNHPVWDPGGKELFFNPGPGQFKSVSVTTKPAFAFGNPVPLPRPFRRASRLMPRAYDITRSGRFVAAIERRQSDGGRLAVPQIQVVLNWFADLQARAPSPR